MGDLNYTYQCGYGRELKKYNVVSKIERKRFETMDNLPSNSIIS